MRRAGIIKDLSRQCKETLYLRSFLINDDYIHASPVGPVLGKSSWCIVCLKMLHRLKMCLLSESRHRDLLLSWKPTAEASQNSWVTWPENYVSGRAKRKAQRIKLMLHRSRRVS